MLINFKHVTKVEAIGAQLRIALVNGDIRPFAFNSADECLEVEQRLKKILQNGVHSDWIDTYDIFKAE